MTTRSQKSGDPKSALRVPRRRERPRLHLRSSERKRQHFTMTQKKTSGKKKKPSMVVSKGKKIETARNDNAKAIHHYRSNLHATVTLLNDANLSVQHQEVLKKTPFWRLYKAILNGQLTSQMCTKHDSDILKILQTYDNVKGVFKLENTENKFEERDFCALFGISCGSHPIQKSSSRKPNSPFVARRLSNVDRIVASHLRSEALNAAAGTKKSDREDFARLLVLHTLISLFFTNSAPNIGWDMLNYVEDLSQIKEYAWSARIHSFLMDSIVENVNTPEKVIGCVISMLYWACEQIKIVDPRPEFNENDILIVKWDLRMVHSSMASMEVRNHVLMKVEDDESQQIHKVKEETESDFEMDTVICSAVVPFKGIEDVDIKQKSDSMSEKDAMKRRIDGLEEIIEGLRREKEAQISTIRSLTEELRRNDEKIMEFEVHNVTQHACDIRDKKIEELEMKISIMTTEHRDRIEDFKALLLARDRLIDNQRETINELTPKDDKHEEHSSKIEEMEDDNGIKNKKPKLMGNEEKKKGANTVTPSSLVKRIKLKERRNVELQDYTYEKNKGKQNKRKQSTELVLVPSAEERQKDKETIEIDESGDEVTERKKQKKPVPFGLRTSIARMLTQGVRDKLKRIYIEEGLMSTVWKAGSNEVNISLEDINLLMREGEVSNFVIDAYARLLFDKQAEMEKQQGNMKNKSFFFPCFTLEMFNLNDKDREGHALNRHLNRASNGFDLLFFPINHNNFHWTLLLFDRTNGEWYHYNSLLPRTSGTRDTYFENCGVVKIYVEEFYNFHESEDQEESSEMLPIFNDFKCPQQIFGSLDCGVFVCMNMKILSEHGHMEERGDVFNANSSNVPEPTTRTILPANISLNDVRKFRAEMITTFVEDPIKSWPAHRKKEQKSTDDDFV